MQNQYDLRILFVKEAGFDQCVRVPDIHGRIREIPFDDALDEIEDDAPCAIVDSYYGSTEC